MTRHTQRKYRVTTEEMLERFGMQPLHYYLDWRILGYAGHVVRMDESRLPKIIRNTKLQGKRKAGAPRKTHKRQLNDSLKRKEIKTSEWQKIALDRNEWRQRIKAVIACAPVTKKAKTRLGKKP